ncbi:MAG: DUF3500 domain-containing protein [Geminicoccaceae bacterium]
MTSILAGKMAEAATELVSALDQAQYQTACRPFPDDDERRLWFYTPTDHGGLPLSAMSSTQHRLVHRLVATGLSREGYATMAAIMGLENILDHLEGWRVDFTRERGRDPLLYYVTIFGEPGAAAWGWRFGGHHVSLHHTIIDGEVVASTPNFFGADPADSPLLGPHLHRPLAAAEDLGRELFRDLDETKRDKALISPVAPVDLVSANRPHVSEGDYPLPIPDLWRNRFRDELGKRVATMQAEAEDALGLTGEHLDRLSFTREPKGIVTADLSHGQIDILRELVGCYLNRLPDTLADAQAALVEKEFKKIRFAWAGGDERYQPHYYRIQGERLFIEYDNTQRGANHIHAVWRDLANDFGGDVLARHYAEHSHVPPAHG